MIRDIFSKTSINEVTESFTPMCRHNYRVDLVMLRKLNYTFFFGKIAAKVEGTPLKP